MKTLFFPKIMVLVLGGVLAVQTGYSQVIAPMYQWELDTMSTLNNFILEDPRYVAFSGGDTTYKDRQMMGAVSVGFDTDKHLCYSEYRRFVFDITVDYEEMTAYPSTFTPRTINRVLEIDFDPLNRQPYRESAVLYIPNAYQVHVIITGVTVYDSTGTTVSVAIPGGLPSDLYLKIVLDAERYRYFDLNTAPAGFGVSYIATDNLVRFAWNAPANGETEYELEWIHVNNYDPTSSLYTASLSASQLYAGFTYTATRVRIPADQVSYEIPALFDRGYIVGRIRGVGKYFQDLDREVKSTWNFTQGFGQQTRLDSIPAGNIASVPQHEGQINWQASGTYAEEGKNKFVVGYADGSFRIRQQVTKISSDNEAIVAETFYDHQGRATVQTLPSPAGSAVIEYYASFNRNTDGLKYSRGDFDMDSLDQGCVNKPRKFGTTSGAGMYYSPANLFQAGAQAFVPDAEGYPFTVTQFTPDNTGRIYRQSGVGGMHFLGSGHDTRYVYGKPAQEELDRLFGTDAGFDNYYKKNLVIDANGQVSVSYIDMAGRVVATSLAGEVPGNVQALKTEDGSQDLADAMKETLTVNVIGSSTQEFPKGVNTLVDTDAMSFTISQSIVVASPQTYAFTYRMLGMDYVDSCIAALCFDCMYDLEISLEDACGNQMINGGAISQAIGGLIPDSLCNEVDTLREMFTADLVPGQYFLTKTLTVNAASIDYYVDVYMRNSTCILPLDSFYIPPDTADCEFSCEACQDKLDSMGTLQQYIDSYINAIVLPPGESLDTAAYVQQLTGMYNGVVQLCGEICAKPAIDMCAAGYEMMLADMKPGGQYAGFYTDSLGTWRADTLLLSIYAPVNLLPYRTTSQFGMGSNYNPVVPSWKYPQFPLGGGNFAQEYREEDGTRAIVFVTPAPLGNYSPKVDNVGLVQYDVNTNTYYTYPENLTEMKDFILHAFKPHYARSLVVYHPEYFLYENCLTTTYQQEPFNGGPETLNSHEFDARLYDLDRATAVSIFGSNLDLMAQDPYFINQGSTIIFGNRTDTTMAVSLRRIGDFGSSNYLDIGKLVYASNYLAGNYSISSYAALTANINMFCMNCPREDYVLTDDDWQTFVGFYLSRKQLVQTYAYASYAFGAPRNNLANCIGNPDFNNYHFNNNLSNPCNDISALWLQAKTPRFFRMNSATQELLDIESNPPSAEELQAYGDYQYYLKTGVCPLARDFEAMLMGLARDGRLGMTTPLWPAPYLSQNLYNEFSALSASTYTPVLSDNDKVLTWDVPNSCPMVLRIPPGLPSYVTFPNVELFFGIHDITENSGLSRFKIRIRVENPVTLQKEDYAISGEVCLILVGCEGTFKSLCKTLPYMKDFLKLMNRLSMDGILGNTTATTLTPTYDSYLEPSIRTLVGPGTITWQYFTGNRFEIGTSGVKIRMNFTSMGAFDPSNPVFFEKIIGDIPPVQNSPTTDNGFRLAYAQGPYTDPFDPANAATDTLRGTMTIWNSFQRNLAVTECDLPASPECGGTEDKNLEELTALLEQMIDLSQIISTPYDTGMACLRNLYLTSTGNPPNGAQMEQLLEVQADMEHSPDGVTSYYFFARIERNGGLIDTLRGQFCKPMKNCEDCHEDCVAMDSLTLIFNFPDRLSALEYEIRFPGENCFSVSPSIYAYNPTNHGSTHNFIVAWAALINANTPYVHASVFQGQLKIKISTAELGPDCPCKEGQQVYIRDVGNSRPIVAQDHISCCESDDPGQDCVPQSQVSLYFAFTEAEFNSLRTYCNRSLELFFDLMDTTCIRLGLNDTFTVSPTQHLSLADFLDYLTTTINTNYPQVTASYTVASSTLRLDIPTSLLDENCPCWSGQTITARWRCSRAVGTAPPTISTAATATINCCSPPIPPPPLNDCYTAIQTLCDQREDARELFESLYQTAFAGWQSDCITLMDGNCNYRLDTLEQWYIREMAAIDSLYLPQIWDIQDTCQQWEPWSGLTLSEQCDPVILPFPVKPYTNPCAEELLSIAEYNAQVRYDQYLDSVRAAVKNLLIAKCMDAGEQFTYMYDVQEYHFTLYYYDQAGNLYRTAPPKAVKPLPAGQLATVASSRLSGTVLLPAHADPDSSNYVYVTEYRFNSLNQPVQQRTPDGGLSKFWYDDLGRLVFSQNAKQNPGKEYSYTYFDAQGRITQVGQLENTTTLTQTIAGNETSRLVWLASATDFEQVTRTYYDSLPGFGMATLTNLRKRVAVMTYEDVDDNNHSTYRSATFYTYDIHGNVKQLWQYNSDMPVAHRTKTMHYYYDLVSGKVNGVAYNPTGRDRYFHQYEYDADNRLRKTHTWEGADWVEIGYHDSTNWQMTDLPLSRLSLWPWDEDAAYEYYKHGPMSRTELGDLKVQGLDYVYTIHGWIKAVNSNTLDEVRDPGNDARVIVPNTHRWVAKDAFGYMLDYYAGDYKSIRNFTATERFDATKHGSGYGPTYITDLFNGNISAMTTTLTEPGTHTIHPQGTAYQYDQLNRLAGMDVWQNLDLVNNEWQSGSPLTDYHTAYTYDANGNLTTLLRNGASSVNTAMDDLTYHYISGTNRLDHVDDAVSSGNYPNDIDDQGAGNYDYDAIGNLIRDNAEGIANIEWTVYGKVKKVTRSSIAFGPDLEFAYGPDGQRIMKKAIYDHPGVFNDSTLTTLYVRDAGGNIMTVYREVENATVGNEFYIMEQDLYGSSRLGTREKVVDLNVTPVFDPDVEGVIYVERGYKKYELSNHLGNVLMVISDRREGMNCTMAGNTYTYYVADILVATDYYPFGSPMPGREWNSTASVNGFNGMRKDDEWQGAGNAYDFGARIYDPRLGRFISVDVLNSQFPSLSSYSYGKNNPIYYIDPDGNAPPKLGWFKRMWNNFTGRSYINKAYDYAIDNGIDEKYIVINKGCVIIFEYLTDITVGDGQISSTIILNSSLHVFSDGLITDRGLTKSSQNKDDFGNALQDDSDIGMWQDENHYVRPLAIDDVNSTCAAEGIMGLPRMQTGTPPDVGRGAGLKLGKFLKNLFKGIPKLFKGNVVKRTSEAVKYTFKVVAKDDDVVIFSTKVGDDIVEFGGNVSRQGNTLTIKNFDIDAELTNKIGIKGLKELINDFGKSQGVDKVIIEGAKRTTGANPGKMPSKLEFDIK